MSVIDAWRGGFTDDEVNPLHAEDLRPFYEDACGFSPTPAALIALA